MAKTKQRDVVCSYCERTHAVNASGKVRKHRSRVNSGYCTGSGRDASGMRLAPERDSATRAIRRMLVMGAIAATLAGCGDNLTVSAPDAGVVITHPLGQPGCEAPRAVRGLVLEAPNANDAWIVRGSVTLDPTVDNITQVVDLTGPNGERIAIELSWQN